LAGIFPHPAFHLVVEKLRGLLNIDGALVVQGNLDLPAAAQLLNDKVESWVREYPEQWLWYHDRWQIKQTLAP